MSRDTPINGEGMVTLLTTVQECILDALPSSGKYTMEVTTAKDADGTVIVSIKLSPVNTKEPAGGPLN